MSGASTATSVHTVVHPSRRLGNRSGRFWHGDVVTSQIQPSGTVARQLKLHSHVEGVVLGIYCAAVVHGCASLGCCASSVVVDSSVVDGWVLLIATPFTN